MAKGYAYAVAKAEFDPLMERLALAAIDFDGPVERFGERVITVRDPDGAEVDLIETDTLASGAAAGFHSATLWLTDIGPTARLLTDVMGYEEMGSETLEGEERLRLRVPGDAPGTVIDLMRTDAPSLGRSGAGTIHHVAFRASSDEAHLAWRERLLKAGQQVTPVIDRQYFNAIYFREPGGVLFEIATDPPGFAVDEPVESLGQSLKLPAKYEAHRGRIEEILPPITVRP
ncbi:MAG: ring-cleaving dioxygenase [Pseudomonadota bacterium]